MTCHPQQFLIRHPHTALLEQQQLQEPVMKEEVIHPIPDWIL
jgi:hypothetical protein